jgi:tetratricopeptide (TPR) repeat protein
VPDYRRDLAMGHHNLGSLLQELGQRPAAEQSYRRALDLRQKLATGFPAVPAYRRELATSHHHLGNLLVELGQQPAAEQAYRRALELLEKLAADFPAVPDYRRELAGSSVSIGNLLRDQGQAQASLPWYAKAIALLEPLTRQQPRLVTERLFLYYAHYGRAEALDKLGRHADAVTDWERTLVLNAEPAREQDMRLGRAQSLARAGEHARAFAEANTLATAQNLDSDTFYNLACVCAVASAVVKNVDTPGADATRAAQTYPARAVELLRQAVAKGYKDSAHMKKDKDLDALRDNEDFKRLVTELEAKKE